MLYADLSPFNKSIFTKYSFEIDEMIPTYRVSGFSLPKNTKLGRQLWFNKIEKLFLKNCEAQGKPDLIHAHSYVGGFAAEYLALKYNIPYLITEHITDFFTETIVGVKKEQISSVYENAICRIAVSKALSKAMGQFTDKENRVIPNMVDMENLFNRVAKRNKKGGTLNFISIGYLDKIKGFDLLIQAFKNFTDQVSQNARLTIIGKGIQFRKLKKKSRDLGIENQIQFTGELTRQPLVEALLKSDIFVLASHLESFGVVFIEAMALGLPVIATKSLGPQEIITKELGILVPKNNVSALTDALVYMSKHHQQFDAQKIRKAMQDKYSGQVISKQLIKLYHSLC